MALPVASKWIPWAVLAITAAVYLPSLTFGFVCDDTQQIVWSQPNFTFRAVPSYFTSDVWSYSSRDRTNYYRPVFLIWLMLNSKFVGLNTVLWHLSAILAHLAATLLFYFLARRLIADPLLAGVAALLFGVHPAHVEAVSWVSGATEALFAILAFAAILCHLRWREESGRWRIASLAFFALALLSKESAVALPVLIAAYEWLFPAGPGSRIRRVVWVVLPYAAVFLLYLPLRIDALGGLMPMTAHWTVFMLWATAPRVLAFYLFHLFLPTEHSLFYPITPVRELGSTNFFIPLLTVAVAAAALLWISRRSPLAAFSSALLIVPILPVLNLRAFPFDDFLHDRYIYLAIAGFSMLIALAIRAVSRGRPWLFQAIVLAHALVLSTITLRTSLYWRDDVTLFSHAVAVAPESGIAQSYLGEALVHEKRWAEALPLLKAALVGYPMEYSLTNAVAHCYIGLGDYTQAAAWLHDAIAMKPQYSESYLNLGMLELHQGRVADAEAHVRRALQLRRRSDASPEFDRYHFALGVVLEQKGDLASALAEYQAELNENPRADDVRDRMLAVQARLGPRP